MHRCRKVGSLRSPEPAQDFPNITSLRFVGFVVLFLCAIPADLLAQRNPPSPSLGGSLRFGQGPVITVAGGVLGTLPLGARVQVRGEVMKASQGIETCEAEFPASQRCSSSPLIGILGLSLHRPVGAFGLGLGAGTGVHVEEEAFGGTSPLVQMVGVVERSLGSAWVAEANLSWLHAFNATWEERLGERLQYFLVGVALRRSWQR